MPTFKFEAMDATGHTIKDKIEADNALEVRNIVSRMGYFILDVKECRRRPTVQEVLAHAKRNRTDVYAIEPETDELTIASRRLFWDNLFASFEKVGLIPLVLTFFAGAVVGMMLMAAILSL